MIKKLRIKFISIAMISLCAIFLMLVGAIYFTMSMNNNRQANLLMQVIANNNGEFPARNISGMNNNMPRFFNKGGLNRSLIVKLDQNNQITDYSDMGRTELTSEDISSMVTAVLSKNKTTGAVNEYHYLISDKDYGKIIVFIDYSIENSLLDRLIETCLFVGFIGVFIFFIIIVLLSYWATRPIQIAFDKQKEFISNASHELKTPLTIISTNASVLESTVGSNKWLQYIQSNIKRMNHLVNDLLNLTRIENSEQTLGFQDFDLGKAILQSALPFESTAYETQKQFKLEVPEHILYHGNEETIKQLIVILLDNAFKYSDERGMIELTLTASSTRKTIKVFNTGAGISKEERHKIFERFYRSDHSRTRETGGYGLGLAIAKSIVEAHKGHITVDSVQGQWISIQVHL